MIRKSIFTCLLLITLYSLILWAFPGVSKKNYAQGVQQGNLVRAQEYLASPVRIRTLVTGSSMSNKLFAKQIPAGWFNLSIDNGSSITSAAIVRMKKNLPEILLIETNTLNIEEVYPLMQSLKIPVWSDLKLHVPALREANQPVSLIGRMAGKIIYEFSKNSQRNEPAGKVNAEIKDAIVKGYDDKPDTSGYMQRLDDLANNLSFLERSGVKIIFFEIPMDSSVFYSREISLVRNMAREKFSSYPFIPVDSSFRYQTADGEHLAEPDAVRYSGFLQREVEKLVPAKK